MTAACLNASDRGYGKFAPRSDFTTEPGGPMRSILLYLLGVPIPIIILIALLYH